MRPYQVLQERVPGGFHSGVGRTEAASNRLHEGVGAFGSGSRGACRHWTQCSCCEADDRRMTGTGHLLALRLQGRMSYCGHTWRVRRRQQQHGIQPVIEGHQGGNRTGTGCGRRNSQTLRCCVVTNVRITGQHCSGHQDCRLLWLGW